MNETTIKQSLKTEIKNRFNLILVASRRARQIQNEERENCFVKQNTSKCTVRAFKEMEL
ncbi:hypothetical protein BVAF_619 [Candidatus Blochmanniella vafra str. BVAF]|uniref:DNA-directed RNA polymerase subunit omega n=2 Tax=Candidatus Blochmanniella vafra TaxID=251535 RepID=E8Q795_BLOVB|nr:DNA-directed RNA polymerase subunit omega [Candidatus Blochmannia vafer]ADR83540.1 DNA-directed RNA polymerase subunit omega [Candidatus Blochmannia vafer]ADR83541.1 DNA-directed RNA polymerase subunit omega [Candidatus Blochmannia vafer]ADR83542.1 DNA-directed RNA polymerase subunit omega [Candidatus Blochmannia vafer]ADR83543.1 DNA-directed RNA polymerase subunit omega [Candidatus Blochmannia vafer]ADR83544.1 DNA-directed RNA polymerase subunit omega [Candidatus Blochmannia vafer]